MITNGNNSVWIIKVLLSFYTAESLLLKELTHSEGRKLAGTAFVRLRANIQNFFLNYCVSP